MLKLTSICGLVFFGLLSTVQCLLDSSLLDALDSAVLALEDERSTKDFTAKVLPVFPRPVVPKERPRIIPFLKTSGGKGFRKISSARRRSYKKGPSAKKPSIKKTRVSLNRNLQAMNQIQNSMLEAAAMRQKLNTASIQQLIKQACNAGQYIFARQMLGHNLYNLLDGGEGRRSRRSVVSAKQILNNVQSSIGNDQYKKLLAYNGGVTLGFVFDTTGSMDDEMDKAKTLARGIVNFERLAAVDYALSPFNDPVTDAYHGPVTFKLYEERDDFVRLIDGLKANGGGDCKEMTINGIHSLFNAPIAQSSPVYIFTDAGAKDATDENVEALKELIGMFQSRLNFFLSYSGCLKSEDIQLYESLAESTGGQILYFSSSSKIALMDRLIQNTLIGGSSIPVIQHHRQRRAADFIDYSITVDNTVDTLSTTVMSTGSSELARLYNPSGKLQVGENTGKGSTLFLINKPVTGVWKLSVPASSANRYVAANCISFENIDFEYNFLVEAKVFGKTKSVASKSPIKGKTAKVVITIPAHRRTKTSSLKLKVVNSVFKPSITISLKQYGRSAGRYLATFPTPAHDFKLIVEGMTRENTRFERLGNGIIKPRTLFFHVFFAPRGFALNSGSSRSTILMFALHNTGARENFEVKTNELV